jgi:hypothetical protein
MRQPAALPNKTPCRLAGETLLVGRNTGWAPLGEHAVAVDTTTGWCQWYSATW